MEEFIFFNVFFIFLWIVLTIVILVKYFQMASDIRILRDVSTRPQPTDSKMMRWLLGDEDLAKRELFTEFSKRIDDRVSTGTISPSEYEEQLAILKKEFEDLDLELDTKTLNKIATVGDYMRLKNSPKPFHDVNNSAEIVEDLHKLPFFKVGDLVYNEALKKQMRITSINDGKYQCHTNQGMKYEGEFSFEELRPF